MTVVGNVSRREWTTLAVAGHADEACSVGGCVEECPEINLLKTKLRTIHDAFIKKLLSEEIEERMRLHFRLFVLYLDKKTLYII